MMNRYSKVKNTIYKFKYRQTRADLRALNKLNRELELDIKELKAIALRTGYSSVPYK